MSIFKSKVEPIFTRSVNMTKLYIPERSAFATMSLGKIFKLNAIRNTNVQNRLLPIRPLVTLLKYVPAKYVPITIVIAHA